MRHRPVLLFVSTRFLFPADSGGKIRTGQILRGLKGGAFRIRLLMPCDAERRARFSAEIDEVCDDLVTWNEQSPGRAGLLLRRLAWIFQREPLPVLADRNREAQAVIRAELGEKPAGAVFDFPHSAILAPDEFSCASIMFTHNIEAEIFARHLEVAPTPVHKWLWRDQHRKMLAWEKAVLRRFDRTIAVSERDCRFFVEEYGVKGCRAIPTGVDTDFFEYREPANDRQVVFCGSMDWMANVDGIRWFHDNVWPLVRRQYPDARMKVVGRTPPDSLVRSVRTRSPEWEFTGFVKDVREHVPGAAAFVIPLRVGGGTRIKAYEAMAMGCPVVSTSIGVEGLPLVAGEHYLAGDDEREFAAGISQLLTNEELRRAQARRAREFVESRFGFRRAAAVFEEICRETITRQAPVEPGVVRT